MVVDGIQQGPPPWLLFQHAMFVACSVVAGQMHLNASFAGQHLADHRLFPASGADGNDVQM
ncbi:hypothetical protein BMD20_12260 [Burkholderia multivorans]|nr:hypothetical protein BMD20_12260 [Burkholderia multivorans]